MFQRGVELISERAFPCTVTTTAGTVRVSTLDLEAKLLYFGDCHGDGEGDGDSECDGDGDGP